MTNEMNITKRETLREKFLTTTGRINRATFFRRTVGLIVAEVLLMFFLMILIMLGTMSTDLPYWANGFFFGFTILTFIPEYCLNTKRLHDLGKDSTLAKVFLGIGILSAAYSAANGLWTASESLPFTPIDIICTVAMFGFMVYLLFAKGTEGSNEYDDEN